VDVAVSQTRNVDSVVNSLDENGYVIVEGMLSPEEVAAARSDLLRVLSETPTGRNDFEGYSTQRVYALFAKTRTFDKPAVDPLLLGVLDRILGHYQFSAPVGIHIGPGEKAQVLHTDDGIYPIARPHPQLVLNTMWALDDFTEDNGATRLIPGSHTWLAPPDGDLEAMTIKALMPAGSVMFYVGSLVHGGGANRTDEPRLGVILEFVVSWLRPQENHVIAVPHDVAAALPERLQELLGYNVHPPFLGYVDGRHPRRVAFGD
jgi:ectoine hydroxylase-related dioxygenase (phytanoyl-CoA dioxygenase family)